MKTTQSSLGRFWNRVAGMGLLGLVAALAVPLSAAELRVGPGETYTTISDAVAAAANGDTIQIAAGTFTENVYVDKSLNIVGAGAAATIVDGGAADSVFFVDGDIDVAIEGVTIQNGSAADGGAIYVKAGTGMDSALAVHDCLFTNNVATTGNGGALANLGLYEAVVLEGCTFTGNTALNGQGGAVFIIDGELAMENCTVSGNTAKNGGGCAFNVGTVIDFDHVTLTLNTATGSPASKGGALLIGAASGTIDNSIVCGNTDQFSSPGTDNINGTIPGGSNNLVDQDAKLGALADNGGPTPTHALLADSPAVNNGAAGTITYDQRGVPRDQGNAPDIGAYETVRIVYVDDDWTGPENAVGHAWGQDAFSTLAAVAVVPDGGVVRVAPGTYAGGQTITGSLTFEGANKSVAGYGTRGPESVVTSTIHVKGQNNTVTFDGFQFTASSYALLYGAAPSTTDWVFKNNLVAGGSGCACYNEGTSNWRDVAVISNKFTVVGTSSALRLANVRNLSVKDNQFTGGFNALQLVGASGDVLVDGNEISNTTNEALKFGGPIQNGVCSNNTISGCNTSRETDVGAIRIRGVALPYNLTIVDNIVADSFNGVAVKDGEDLEGANILIARNDFTGNEYAGVYNGGTGLWLMAASNYWGAATGIIDGTGAAGDVIYEPYFTDAAMSNLAPYDLSLSAATVAENTAAGFTVGTLGTTDADAGDTFTYAFVTSKGDHNYAFTLDGNSLKTAEPFDYETQPTRNVNVQTSDGKGGVFVKEFTITVTDVNEAPVLAPIGDRATDEDVELAFAVEALDQDNDELTYTWTGVPAWATAAGTSFSGTPREGQASVSTVTVTVSDGEFSDDETFTVTVGAVNDAPVVAAALPDLAKQQDFADVTIDLGPVFSDIEGDTLAYSVSVDGVVDASVAGSQLTLAALDAINGVATVTVTATETGTAEQHAVSDVFTVTVKPVWNTTRNTFFDTIPAAIADPGTVAGDEITVAAGTYAGSISVSKGIALRSVAGAGETTLAGAGTDAVKVEANGVEIRGFTISNPSGLHGIYAYDRSGLRVAENIVENIGTAVAVPSGAVCGVMVYCKNAAVADVVIETNTIRFVESKGNKVGANGIWVGDSTGNFDVTGLVIEGNAISNIKASPFTYEALGRGAYGMILNHANAAKGYTGRVVAPRIVHNTITDLEGVWSHAIGLEGNTPDALVAGNVIDRIVDHKSPADPDAVGVMVEANASAASVTIEGNSFLDVWLGVRNLTAIPVAADANYWGAAAPDLDGRIAGPVAIENFYADAGLTDLRHWVVYVDNDFDASTEGWGVNRFATIQNGVNAVSTYGTVNVAAGTYNEHVTVAKTLNLVGAGAATTTINGGGSGVVVMVTASDVAVSGFTVTGSGVTPIVDAGMILQGASGCVVSDCAVGPNGGVGIGLQGANGNTIQNNTLAGNAIAGIGLLGSANNTVASNTVSATTRFVAQYGYGIVLDGVDLNADGREDLFSTGNTISGNTCSNNQGDGVYLGWACNGNTIEGNTLSGNGNNGLYVWKADGNTVQGNTVSGNVAEGIQLMASSDNEIVGNVIGGSATSLWIRSGWTQWEAHTAGHEDLSSGNRIEGNTFLATVAGVAIEDNADYTLDDAGLVDVSANYWGTESGPSGDGFFGTGSAIVGAIDIASYFVGSPLTTLHYYDLYVDGSYAPEQLDVNHFATIQAAYAAANPGDTIHVADGEYELATTFTVAKQGLTLSGASRAGVEIDVSARTGTGIGIKVAASDVTLEHFTLIPATYVGAGFPIHVSGTPGILSNITLRDIAISGSYRTPFDFNGVDDLVLDGLVANGAQWGSGIGLSGCVGVTIAGCQTAGNAWGGVRVSGSTDVEPDRASSGVNVDVAANTFGEPVALYVEDTVSTVNVAGYSYRIESAFGASYLNAGITEAQAVAMALQGQLALGIPVTGIYDNGTATYVSFAADLDKAEVYVDDDWALVPAGAGVPKPGAAGTYLLFGHNAFASVQHGVAAVDAAGTVRVMNGTYKESNILVTRPLTVAGETLDGVVLVPAGEDDQQDSAFGGVTQNGFVVRSDDVTLTTLTLDGQGNADLTPAKNNYRHAIMTDSTAGSFDRLRVENVVLRHVYRRAIVISNTDSTGNVIADCTISDVTFRDGIMCFGGGQFLRNTITDIHGGSGGAAGIRGYSLDCEYVGNAITNVIWGIVVDYGDALIADNRIHEADVGIVMNNIGYPDPNLALIQGNAISGIRDDGVSVMYGVAISVVNLAEGSLIGGPDPADANVFDLSGGTGLVGLNVWWNPGKVTIQNNLFEVGGDNTAVYLQKTVNEAAAPLVTGNTFVSQVAGFGCGVHLDEGDDNGNVYATVQDNLFADLATAVLVDQDLVDKVIRASLAGNWVEHCTVGLDVVGGQTSIADNTIAGCGTAVRVDGGAVIDAFADNTFAADGEADNAIDLCVEATAGAVTIGAGNAFAGDTCYIQNLSTQDFDLSANSTTFDEASPYDVEDLLYHKVDDTALGLVRFAVDTIYVTHASGSIQRAIDAAAAGDTVSVAVGTYAQSVNIAKSLSLVASGAATIIGTTENAVTVAADGVSISGFTIQNPDGLHGIYALNRNRLNVSGNTVENIGTAVAVPGSAVCGVMIYSTSAAMDDIAVVDNMIRGIRSQGNKKGANGVWVGDSAGNLDITGLVIQGNVISNVVATPSAFADGGRGAYGIIINHAITGTGRTVAPLIKDNLITDLDGVWAHAIGLEGNTPNAVVQGNVIARLVDHKSPADPDAIGIMVEGNASADTVILVHNIFDDLLIGVRNATALEVVANSNYWDSASGPAGSVGTIGTVSAPIYYTDAGFSNLAPYDLALSGDTVAENAAAGTLVGTLATTDLDAGDSFTYSLVAGAGDDDNASFAVDGEMLKTAASFDFETKSSYTVRIQTSDGNGGSYAEAFTITVVDVNEAPVLVAIGAQSVDELVALTFTATASDVDAGDSLTFTLGAGAPAGATLSAAGAFAWTPTEAQGPGVYDLTITVADAGGLSVSETFAVTVAEVNVAPEIASIPDQEVNELAPLSFTASATDDDLPANTLTFSLDGAPDNVAINGVTGEVTWTPTEAQGPGTYEFDVVVTDDGAVETTTLKEESFEGFEDGASIGGSGGWTSDSAVVSAAPEDQPTSYAGTFPLPGATHTKAVKVASDLTLAVSGTGRTTTDMLLRPERSATAPSVPAEGQVAVAFSDVGGLFVLYGVAEGETVTATWTSVPVTPALVAGDWVRVTIETDYDNLQSGHPAVRVSVNGAPLQVGGAEWFLAAMAADQANVLQVTGQCVLDDVHVTSRPSGAAGLSDRTPVKVTVNEVNVGPVANGDSYTVAEAGTLTVAADAGVLENDTDADEPANTLAALTLSEPAHGTLTLNADGSFTYVHNGTEPAPDSFTYKVNDGLADSGVATVSITVTPVNDAPRATAVLPNLSLHQDFGSRTVSLAGLFTDDENDAFALSASVAEVGVVYVSVAGETLTLESLDGQSGEATVTVTATETATGTPQHGSTSFTVTVKPVWNVTQNTFWDAIQPAVDAAAEGDEIRVAAGTYDERVVVATAGLTLRGVGAASIVTGTSAAPAAGVTPSVFKVAARNVTIAGFHATVDFSFNHSGVHTSGDCAGLTVETNAFVASVSAGTAYGYGLRNAIAVNPLVSVVGYTQHNTGYADVTIAGNTVGASTGVFRAGVQMDLCGGSVTGNTILSINHDFISRFANQGEIVVSGNTFLGGGAQAGSFNPGAGTVTFESNVFDNAVMQPESGALGTGASLRLIYFAEVATVDNAVVVRNNTFRNHRWGVSVENFKNVTFDGNTFTPKAGATDFVHLSFNTKIIASTAPASLNRFALGGTLVNNVFEGSGVAGGTALAFYNHHSDGALFGTFTLGLAGEGNDFEAGIANVVALDASAGSSSDWTVFGGYGTMPVTTMAPWSVDLDLQNNRIDVGSGLELPAAMSLANLLAVEDAIVHKLDNAALGLVRVKAGEVFVTQASGSIQRGVNAATPGDTVHVGAGTFTESLGIDRSVTLLGANANAPFGSRGPETRVQQLGGATIMTVMADDVAINGFELYGPLSNNAITSQNSPVGRSGLSFTFNHVHDIGTTRGSGNIYGFHYMLAADAPSSITVADNLFERIGNGATLGGSAGGIYFGQSTSTGTLDGVLIERNVVRDVMVTNGEKNCWGIVIGVGWNSTGTAENLIIRNNDVSGITGGFASGISLGGNTPGAVVSNNKVGSVTSASHPDLAAAVLVETNTGAGSVLIAGNDLSQVACGILNKTAFAVSAEGNWFGAPTGPTHASNPGGTGTASAGLVDFSPWLADGTDDQPLVIGFQPVADPAVHYLPTALTFATQPGGAALGAVLTAQPVVHVMGENNEIATQYNGPVTLAIGTNPGSGELAGTLTVDAVAGVATFDGLAVTLDGGSGFTLTATVGSLVGESDPFDILNPAPSLTAMSPIWKPAGSAGFELTLDGESFVASSVVRWSGVAKTPTSFGATQLKVWIDAADVATAGTVEVEVFSPAAGGGTSQKLYFTVTALGVPTEVWVDDNWTGYGTTGVHVWGYDAFATIQSALTGVAQDGVVHVLAGTYTETASTTKRVKIAGELGTNGDRLATLKGSLYIDNDVLSTDGFEVRNLAFEMNGTHSLTLYGVNGGFIENCAFIGNATDWTGFNAILLKRASKNGNTNILVQNCVFYGGCFNAVQGYSSFVTIDNCSIQDVYEGAVNLQGGNNLVVQDSDIVVTAQTTGNAYCIRFPSSSADNLLVSGCDLRLTQNNPAAGQYQAAVIVRASAGGDLKVENCSIQGGIVNLDDTMVYASGNWWGSADAAAVRTAANGGTLADYSPWLAVGTDTDEGAVGFKGDFSALWVDDDSAQVGDSGLIQEGVDLVAEGGTVNVAAGTYVEQVVVDKPLAVQGAGQGATIIKAFDAMPATFTTPGPSVNHAVVTVQGTDGVRIADLTVDGDHRGATNVRFEGIGIRDAGVQVSNVLVTGVRNEPFSGAQHGTGIYGYNDDGVNRTVTVTDCDVVDFQKSGIVLNGANMQATVCGCTVTGAGETTVTAQNGIQLGSGASGTICHNTVADCYYLSDSWSSSAILGASVSSISIVSNTVTGCAGGLRVDNYYGVTSPVLIEGNVLDGSGFSTVWGCEDVTVVGNSFESNDEALWLIDTVGVVAEGNSFTDCGYGVIVYGDSADIVVRENGFEGSAVAISSGAVGEVVSDSNWFGSTTGPANAANPGGAGAAVEGAIDFSPWLAEGDQDAGTLGFQPNLALYFHRPVELVFATEPVGGMVDATLPTQPVVWVLDEVGNVATQFSGSIALAIGTNPGAPVAGVLDGTVTLVTTQGVATFEGLKILDGSGTGYRLVASSEGLPDATSAEFDIGNHAVSIQEVQPAWSVANEQELLTFTVTAFDADLPTQSLSFALDQAARDAGMAITKTEAGLATFAWTPTEAQGSGAVYPVTITVTDDGSPATVASRSFAITVAEVNVAPELAEIGDKSVDEQELLTFTASATDQDEPAQTLSYSLAGDVPVGADIDSATGEFTWTPTEEQGGAQYTFSVVATDDGANPAALTDVEEITVTVAEVNVAPVLDPIAALSVNFGETLAFTVGATDQDRVPTQSLVFSLEAVDGMAYPDGATIATADAGDGTATGSFSWTPTEAQAQGNYGFRVKVTDNGDPALSAERLVTIGAVSATHACVGFRSPSSSMVVSNSLAFGGSLDSLVWTPELPDGWTLLSVDTAGNGEAAVVDGAIVFETMPTASPARFAYTVQVPGNEAVSNSVAAVVAFGELVSEVAPIAVYRYHSADYQRDRSGQYRTIDSWEMTRVLSHWRAGAYQLSGGTSDGYVPATATDATTLANCHSADYNRDGSIDSDEWTLVQAYWGSLGYHVDPAGEDGYAPLVAGPGPSLMGFATMALEAEPQTAGVTVEQGKPAGYAPGEVLVVSNSVNVVGDTLSSLFWRYELPTGWRIVTASVRNAATGLPLPHEIHNGNEVVVMTSPLPPNVAMECGIAVPLNEARECLFQAEARYRTYAVIRTTAATNGPMALAPVDGDGNGVADAWERHYAALLGKPLDLDVDQDGDRHTARQEYYAGTVPTDSQSVLQMHAVTLRADGLTEVTWSSESGRTYSLQRADGTPSAEAFVPIATGIAPDLSGTNAYVDDADTDTPRFYRVLLESPAAGN